MEMDPAMQEREMMMELQVGITDLSTHLPKISIPFSLVSCITNRKFVGNVAQTRIRLSHESKAVLDLLMRAQLG